MFKKTYKKLFLFSLKLAFTLGSFIWCWQLIDLNKIEHLFGNVRHNVLIWFLPLVILHTATGAMRFKILIDPHYRLGFFQHLHQYFSANYFNLILPSSIGGDVVRIFMLNKKGISKSQAAGYIFSERLMGLYSLILIAFSASATVTVSEDVYILVIMLGSLACISFVLIYLIIYLFRNVQQYHIVHISAAIKDLWKHKFRLICAMLISLLYQFMTISFTLLIAKSLNLDVSVLIMLALVPLVWLITFLPISIGGVGVREISFIGLFTQVGLSSEQAVLLSIGTYASMVLAGLLGGIWTAYDTLLSKAIVTNQG